MRGGRCEEVGVGAVEMGGMEGGGVEMVGRSTPPRDVDDTASEKS